MINKKILIVLLILIIACGIFIFNNAGYETYKSKDFEIKYDKDWEYEESENSVTFYFKSKENAISLRKMENKSNKKLEAFSNEYKASLSLDTVKASNIHVSDIKVKDILGKIDAKKFEFDLDGQGLEDAEGNKIEKTHIIQIVAVKGENIYNGSFRISQTINGEQKIFINDKTYQKIENSIKFK